MAGMDFSDFLDKIGTETGGRKVRPEPEPIQIREEIEERPIKKKRKVVEEIDYDDEPIREEIEVVGPRIDEEFRDKAYDYAQGVIKVVRQNFKSTEERVVMLESLNRAVSYYLQSVGAQPAAVATSYQPINGTVTEGNITWGGETMSESDWDKMPKTYQGQTPGGMNDLTGQSVTIQPEMAPTGDYKSDLKLGIKIAPDGKQEADLSGVTAADINEMRVLAGMVGPEAESKNRELAAARQEVARQVAEKNSLTE